MSILINNVFSLKKKLYRVLYMDKSTDMLAAIELGKDNVMPEITSLSLWQKLENSGKLIQEKDAYIVDKIEDEISASDKEKRDQAWNLIKGLVNEIPSVFITRSRGKLVRKYLTKNKTSKPTLYKYLRWYWQKGQTLNALLPLYYKSGGRNKEKKSSSMKRGRPSPYHSNEGVNVTDSTKKKIEKGVRLYVLKKKLTYKEAYRQTLIHLYNKVDKNGFKKPDYYNLPTFAQFYYWSKKLISEEEKLKKQRGQKIFEKDYRLLHGNVNDDALGPGSLFQIDSTIADFYIVSQFDRNKIVGRPTFYSVVDTFSRMIVGFYLGLEAPSYISAALSLLNTGSNKAAYCKKLGIEIDESDWPCHFLPKRLIADRAELLKKKSDTIVKNLGVTLENTPSYRPDLKAIVESRFKEIQKRIKPALVDHGYVDKNFGNRGSQDVRLQAKVSLKELTQILTLTILEYNRTQWIENYPLTQEMIKDGLKPIPINLWNWGIEKGYSVAVCRPEEAIKRSLLPREKVSLYRKGIRFKGEHFTIPKTLSKSQIEDYRKSRRALQIAYDPRDLSEIYVIDENNEFHISTPSSRSKSLNGKNEWELQAERAEYVSKKYDHAEEELKVKHFTATKIDEIMKKAEDESSKKKLPKSKKTEQIRRNRKLEKDHTRKEEQLKPKISEEKPRKTPVKPISPNSYPKQTDLLRKLKKSNEG